MAAKTRPEGEPPAVKETLQPLPYRPTCKLTRIPGTDYNADGWRSRRFRDEEGRIYERDRDGHWERWSLITRTEYEDGTVQEMPGPQPEPFDYYEALDFIDDLYFMQGAIRGLFDDARAKGRFDALNSALVGRLSEAISELTGSAISLGNDLERFHPEQEGQ